MPVAGGAGCGMCTRHCACGTALALRGRTEGAQPGNAHNRAADVVDLTTAPDLTDRTDGADGVGDADELNPASRVGEAPGTATRARPAKEAYTVDCDGGLTRDDSSDEGEQLSFVSLNYDDADLRDLRVAFGLGSDVTKHLCSKEKRAASAASGSVDRAMHIMWEMMDTAAESVSRILVGEHQALFVSNWHSMMVGDQGVLGCVGMLLGLLKPGTAEHDILSAIVATGARESEICKKLVQNASGKRKLFKTIVGSGGSIPKKPKRTVQRCSNKIVEAAVSFIMDPHRTNMLSWGLKTVTVDGEVHEIPALSRQMSKASFFAEYLLEYPDAAGRLNETSFHVLLKTLTAKQDKSVNAVDYKISELVPGRNR